MSITVIERPTKEITDSDGVVRLDSYYNASGGDLPTQYKFSNDISPSNYAEAETATVSVSNISGRTNVFFTTLIYDAIDLDDRFSVDAWLTLTHSSGLVFIGQIVSFSNEFESILTTIPYDTLFDSGTITWNWYAKDYEVLVNVYVGLNPNHLLEADQPSTIVAQKSITSFINDTVLGANTATTNITGLIKDVINASFEDITTTVLNLNQYTQFRIEISEVYKRINPDTEQNELFDGTNYQSDWVLKQPVFVPDSFDCNAAELLNEEFTTDLTNWTNDTGGVPQWSWVAGEASVDLDAVGVNSGSSLLSQPFTYEVGAVYQIDYSIASGLNPIVFGIFLESATRSELINRVITDGAATVGSFTFTAAQMGGEQGETPQDPVKISLFVYNSSGVAVTAVVDYFRQTFALEGCYPFLSGMYSVRQFGSEFGGSMGDYEGTLGTTGKLLTYFKNKILNTKDVYPELSVIGNSNTTNSRVIGVKALVTYSDNSTVQYYSADSESGEGLYRVVLSGIITSIQGFLSVNPTLSVKDIDLTGISNVNNLVTAWDKGTFETGVLPFTSVNPDSIGSSVGVTDSTENPYIGTRSGKLAGVFDFTDVADFTKWSRFAHGNLHLGPATSAPRSGVWADEEANLTDIFTSNGPVSHVKNDPALYNSTITSITTSSNCNAYYGCISPDTYEAYVLKGEMFSTDASDNDCISFVVCFVTDGGIEHSLSLVATTGGIALDLNTGQGDNAAYIPGDDQTTTFSFTTSTPAENNVKWALVYDFGKSGCKQLAVFDTGEDQLVWNSVSDLEFKVTRDGNDITAEVISWTIRGVDYGSTDFPAGILTFDLNGDVDTQKFSGSNSIGFAFMSEDQGGFQNVEFNTLGGGIITDTAVELQAGNTYIASAYVDTVTSSFVDNSANNAFVAVGLFDVSDVLITTGVEYELLYNNTTGYERITAVYTPIVTEQVKVGVYKGGSDASAGAQVIYFDEVKVQGPSVDITDSIKATYLDSGSCYDTSIKWLNDLGGWENFTFEGRKSEEININDVARYKAPVFGNWPSTFINGTGTSFEQSIKYNHILTVTTPVINEALNRVLSTIQTSIHVLMYNVELARYITVLVDKNSFNIYKDGVSSYRVQFDLILPDNFVQNA